MANKKLKVEVELETARAKRQAKELESSSGGSASPSASSPDAASSRAARQIRELGDAAAGTKVNMKEVTRAFSGMAVGMAANYAAKSMKPGAARDAVEYGGAAMTGAAMGMMAGPIGMAVGALGGMLKTYLDKEGSKSQATADFILSEHDYESARAFKKTIEGLTEVGDHFELLDRNIEETRRQLEQYRQVEKDLVGKVKSFRNKGDEESAKLEEGYLAQNRTRQESLEGVLKNLEKQQKTLADKPEFRASMTGTDALQKIGAGPAVVAAAVQSAASAASPSSVGTRRSFGFSVPSGKAATMSFGDSSASSRDGAAIRTAAERSAELDEEMAKTLKEIAVNTKGADTWQ